MPQLVPGSGEGQNQIKEPLRRSGTDGQSSRMAVENRQSMTGDAGRIRSILRQVMRAAHNEFLQLEAGLICPLQIKQLEISSY